MNLFRKRRIEELEATNKILKDYCQALNEENRVLEEWVNLLSPRFLPTTLDPGRNWKPAIFGKPVDRVMLLVQLDEAGTPEQKKAYAAGVPLEDIFA